VDEALDCFAATYEGGWPAPKTARKVAHARVPTKE